MEPWLIATLLVAGAANILVTVHTVRGRDSRPRKTILVLGIWLLPLVGVILVLFSLLPASPRPSNSPKESHIPWI
jgi:hypothetical protein